MKAQVDLDDLAASLQGWFDRVVRRLRLGAPPRAGRRRLLVIQIDGLPRSVFEESLAAGAMPFLRRLLRRGDLRKAPMSVGLPTSTPAFQMSLMYGVRPDIPAFHYHDKRRGVDIHFPRAGDAALVENAHSGGRLGILRGGSSYGCVFAGGADNDLFTFARLLRPSGKGVLRVISGFIVFGWVLIKNLTLSVGEAVRALIRTVIAPRTAQASGWRWLALKIGVSVWLRQLYTLAVSSDLYAGVPAVYVNYVDYDVLAHAFGPRDRRALRALRGVDASLRRLWNVLRRVPEHRYDLYVLSDHGQACCIPYQRLSGGKPLEEVLLDEFFDLAGADEPGTSRPGGGLWSRIKGRRHRGEGLFRKLQWLCGDVREASERGGIRVVSAGPNALVYFLETSAPLTVQQIDDRHPGLMEAVSQGRGIGFVLARSTEGPVCAWRGKRYALSDAEAGPFAGRPDLDLVLQGIRDLLEMPSAGDLVIYGNDAPEGNVSFIPEVGAHAGPSVDELHTFILHPPAVRLPEPIVHPIQLYPLFLAYQKDP